MSNKSKHRILFVPILAGAGLPDRFLACCGALMGIGLTALICAHLSFLSARDLPLLVAPMGASAVLVFAVPASPLAQPWPVLGGNTVSALVGVAAARFVPDPALAAGLAVGGAILAMSLLRCLHPPGGAAALTAVIGGPAIFSAGYLFALVPVCLNSAVLLMTGWLFHRFSRHSYPHRPSVAAGPAAPPPSVPRFHPNSIDRALEEGGETFDISREDLEALLDRAEFHEEERRQGR